MHGIPCHALFFENFWTCTGATYPLAQICANEDFRHGLPTLWARRKPVDNHSMASRMPVWYHRYVWSYGLRTGRVRGPCDTRMCPYKPTRHPHGPVPRPHVHLTEPLMYMYGFLRSRDLKAEINKHLKNRTHVTTTSQEVDFTRAFLGLQLPKPYGPCITRRSPLCFLL